MKEQTQHEIDVSGSGVDLPYPQGTLFEMVDYQHSETVLGVVQLAASTYFGPGFNYVPALLINLRSGGVLPVSEELDGYMTEGGYGILPAGLDYVNQKLAERGCDFTLRPMKHGQVVTLTVDTSPE